MEEDKNGIRFGVYLDRDLLDQCDAAISQTNARSRSEFIADALEFYLAWLGSQNYSKVLTPALESVIDAKISGTEKRLSGVLYKQSIELAMLMHTVASLQSIDEDTLEDLRKLCVLEVRRLNGQLHLEDVVHFQNS